VVARVGGVKASRICRATIYSSVLAYVGNRGRCGKTSAYWRIASDGKRAKSKTSISLSGGMGAWVKDSEKRASGMALIRGGLTRGAACGDVAERAISISVLAAWISRIGNGCALIHA
jgi:hypothetical protein